MPEVINLLSSTPSPPGNRHEPPSSVRRIRSSPPAPGIPIPFPFDDIDIPPFTYDDDDNDDNDSNKPSKRRRLSHEHSHSPTANNNNNNHNKNKNASSLFVFSDDIALSSDGPVPGPSDSKTARASVPPPCTLLESDPIVFTSSAPERIGCSRGRSRSRSPRSRETKRRVLSRTTNAIYIDDSSDGVVGITGGTGSTGTGTGTAGGSGSGSGGVRAREKAKHDMREDEIEEFSDPLRVPDPSELFDFREEGVGFASTGFSSRTASLLASLGARSKSKSKSGSRSWSRFREDGEDDELDGDDDDEVPEPEPRKGPGRKKATTTNPDKEAKAREREAAKAQKDRERQLEKERKQKLKEEKAKEKQLAADIAQANKLKVDKKHSTPEMIVDIASTLKETSVSNQTVEYMRRLGVEHTFFDSSISNVVKWRRKMTARFNDSLGYWEPCPPFIREEEHVLCLLTAREFVDMVVLSEDSLSELEVHVLRLKDAYPRCTVIYLIEGLTAFMRKNANTRNRAYRAEFRRQLDRVQGNASSSTATSTSRNITAAPTSTIDDDTIEDALLDLQVTHGCLIHHTAAVPESAEWIKIFTEHVATVPYRRQRMDGNDSAFCMDNGQVKPGENKSDTFLKMLQEVNRVTGSMAYGVINEYPSVIELVRGMRRHGPTLLEDVKKSANKNGALTDSRIGTAVSKRLYKVFMGMDPASTDI